MSSFDNPDYIHLRSLSDMLKNVVLWATAADAQVQILLAKRAPVMNDFGMHRPPVRTEPGGNPCGEVFLRHESGAPLLHIPPLVDPTAFPTTKKELRKLALAMGIPEVIIDGQQYLNGKSRPSLVGIVATQSLLAMTKQWISEGKNPAEIWTGSSNQAPTDPEKD